MLFENNPTFKHSGFNLDEGDVRQLPQFLRSTPDYVYKMGGPLYRKILNSSPLIGKFQHVSIDSRIHMLMPGQLACIGGWHCDDFYRPTGEQPDLANVPPSLHHAALFGADVAPTLFLLTEMDIPDEALRESNVYKACHQHIEKQEWTAKHLAPGEWVTFGPKDFHRGSQSKGRGWRLFIRITESDHYIPLNEIRTQTQVYLIDEAAGW